MQYLEKRFMSLVMSASILKGTRIIRTNLVDASLRTGQELWESLDELVRSAISDPNDILSYTSSKVSHQAEFDDIFSDLDVPEDWPLLNLSIGKSLPSPLDLSNLPHRRMISATLPPLYQAHSSTY
jgi:hypothetical protein